jgi:hypothetical protein
VPVTVSGALADHLAHQRTDLRRISVRARDDERHFGIHARRTAVPRMILLREVVAILEAADVAEIREQQDVTGSLAVNTYC